jgi:hypothetical protein
MTQDPEVGTYVEGRGWYLGRDVPPVAPWPVLHYSSTRHTRDELAESLASEYVQEMEVAA